jgi:hypothetical protein
MAGFFVRSRDGRVYSADPMTRMIHVFRPDGSHEQSIGRRGDGPGEFQAMGRPGLVADDSILGIADANRGVLIQYAAESGTYLREDPWPGGAIAVGAWVEVGDRVIIPVSGQAEPYVIWNRKTGSVEAFSAMPPEWAGSSSFSMRSGFAGAVEGPGGGWLAQLQLVGGVVRLDSLGSREAVIAVPSLRRRANPGGAAQAYLDAARRDQRPDLFALGAMTAGIGRRPDGLLTLLHIDFSGSVQDTEAEPLIQKLFVSLVDPGDGRSCVDGAVPLEPDDLALPQFVGDTMFFLTQHVTDAGSVQRWLRSYVVDASGCTWITADDQPSP